MKQITGVYTAPAQHWVGDGFPVRSMFSYQTHGEQLSPSCCWTTPVHTFPGGKRKTRRRRTSASRI
jgi:hypothetical protein